VSGTTDSPDSSPERTLDDDAEDAVDEQAEEAEDKSKRKGGALREGAILVVIAVGLYYLLMTFIARPYLIPSESMEPTLHGCAGCTGDRIMVDKLSYRFTKPEPGDVVVFKGPPNWNAGYKSIRSKNPARRWVENTLSVVGFVPPDENDLVKRVIATGGQTVECRQTTGLTVDGKPLNEPYLNFQTMKVSDPDTNRCLGFEFGPVKVPENRVWVMGDNRTHSADSRVHCSDNAADFQSGIKCTGDPNGGTVPLANIIGKARFIAWPIGRWGGVTTVDPQTQ
jgi:signal peptidase I